MEPDALTPTIDWRQLERWRIDPALLPPASDIRFREPTVWEQYRGYIVSAIALILVQSTLIGALLVQRTRRRRSEVALQETLAELSRVSRLTALGEFAASIAHEVRQPLTAIILNARSCLHDLASTPPDLHEVQAGLLDVVDAAQRAESVIQRNRELFRTHTVQTATLDINGVIKEAMVLAGRRLAETSRHARDRARRRPSSDQRRPDRAAAGVAQPHRQRHRCHGTR